MAAAKKMPTARSAPKPTHSGRFTDLDADKLRGGYYTSDAVAHWLCAWAIQSADDQVLEPSCGDGAFLKAAALRFKELGLPNAAVARRLTGIEILAPEAMRARAGLQAILGESDDEVVETSDFFSWCQKPQRTHAYSAIVGNPPFIRYQTFPEPHRTRAMQLMQAQGLAPNRLTNVWVPFVVAAVSLLRPGGRLALVLPAELLQVTYAAQLRSYLTDRFERIDIVTCNELFFDGAEQEVVLLLADGLLHAAAETNPCRVTLTETLSVQALTERSAQETRAAAQPKTIRHDSEKWLKYFLTAREITFMRELRDAAVTTSLATHAGVDVGVVTGKNEFFVLTSEQIDSHGLGGYTTPLVSRSTHLKGARVGKADWDAMAAAGDRVHLLHLKPVRGAGLSEALARYIRAGEGRKVHEGYKCSIREPWYEVPAVWNPDGFVFRQIYDFPRVVLNQAEATSTDTIHRLKARQGAPERIIANTYTWMTAASAEIEGRSYGGGVLELEPTEAERLLMPAQLNGAMPVSECDRLTRAGQIDQVLEENARAVLMAHMGLSKADCLILRDIWIKMRDRRRGRGKAV